MATKGAACTSLKEIVRNSVFWLSLKAMEVGRSPKMDVREVLDANARTERNRPPNMKAETAKNSAGISADTRRHVYIRPCVRNDKV